MGTAFRNIVVLTPRTDHAEEACMALRSMRFRVLDHFASAKLRRASCDLMLVDIQILMDLSQIGDSHDFRLGLETIQPTSGSAPVVILSDAEHMRQAVKAIQAGAHDYLNYPLEVDELRLMIDSVETKILVASEVEYLREQNVEVDTPMFFRTNSTLMQNINVQVKRVAPTRSTVLITGETGTGKTLLAKQIHQLSPRSDEPFISVHCGAIPESLLESELFGHEKGAFTGAVRQKLGKFDIARGGTIFLDEIGTVTPATQIKLLQVLQERTFSRVGGEQTIEADVRVIAATNDDLGELAKDGKFRHDLYYRLNVFPLYLPPLRERIEDLGILVDGFLKRMGQEVESMARHVHESVLQAFRSYDWPGNIRELENLLERACILADSDVLMPSDFPVSIFNSDREIMPVPDLSGTLQEVRQRGVEELERRYLHELLSRFNGRINDTAGEAGVSTRQLHKLMVRYGLHKEDYK